MTARGRETASSSPSRRIFSIRIVRCSSPRPETSKTVSSSVSLTRNATLCFSSRINRSRNCRLVTNLPSRPASGEVFTQKFMVNVGSSIAIIGSACGFDRSHRVAPMPISSMPLTNTISPAFDALQSFELVNLVDFARQYVAAWAKAQRNGLAFVQRAARDAADADASNIARIVQRGDLQLQRPVWVRSAHRDILQDGFKQRL